MRYLILPSALLLGLGFMSSTLVSAAGFDGRTNLVCATINVVACTEGPVCMQGTSQTFELPSFIFVDFKNKMVRGTDEGGHDEVSPIKNHEKTESQIILQGIENHHGWTLAIDRQTGGMNLSSSGADVGFLVMGNCTAL